MRVGAKSAARIILELKDKMSDEMLNTSIASGDFINSAQVFVPNSAISEASEALGVLGYDRSTVMSILKDVDPSITDVSEIIRLALKKLSR